MPSRYGVEDLPPLNSEVTVTMTNGNVHTGVLTNVIAATPAFVLVTKDEIAPTVAMLTGYDIAALQVNGVAEHPPTHTATISPEQAREREQHNLLEFERRRKHIGLRVTKEAQDMYDMFLKQLPRDTAWYHPGESQDIKVLGVRVSYPFAQDCCSVCDADGAKSLQRITNMALNFVKAN